MIQSYTDLQSAITDYVDGAKFDPPTMIALAEADFRRQIVATEQEVTVTLDTVTPTLPNDVDSIRALSIGGTFGQTLTQISPANMANLSTGATGQPSQYAISGGTLTLWPVPDQDYQAALMYRQAIPALSATNATNWLLAAHPDAYLFGSVLQAELYGWNDARLPLLQSKLQAIIDDINMAASRKRYGGGPLAMRAEATDATPSYPYAYSYAGRY